MRTPSRRAPGDPNHGKRAHQREGPLPLRTGRCAGAGSCPTRHPFAGAPATERSDLYSLGVVLFQLCAGRVPAAGERLGPGVDPELAAAALSAGPNPLTEREREVLAAAADGATVDATDGVRVNTPEGWWLLRASNTQDVLVARAEATDQRGLDLLVTEIDQQLALSEIERTEGDH